MYQYHKDINNYRPISNLLLFNKLLERVVNYRLRNFVQQENLISRHQFGFRENSSTTDAILDLIHHVLSALNKKQYSIWLFLDLRKAFDLDNIDILL